MASKSVTTRTKIEPVLKLEIESIFGRRIRSSRDCAQLSDEIFRKTQIRLNPNTLRRFFGLVKADYPASLSTLNILATYCGFQSLDDVDALTGGESAETDSVQQKSVLNYLVSLFHEMLLNDPGSKVFHSWIKYTTGFLNNNPGLSEKFQNQILRTENGRNYYFRHFTGIDNLNAYYGRGLRYYISEQPAGQTPVFVYSLLVFRYWLNADNENLEKNFRMIRQKLDPSLDASVCGRYFAALLYHAHVSGEMSGEIVTEISGYYSHVKPGMADVHAYLSFLLAVGEALVLTGDCMEGLFYLDQAGERYMHAADAPEVIQTIRLFQAIAFYKLDDMESAVERFDAIKPFEFSPLSKKYLTALYLLLSVKLKRRIPKDDEERDILVKELGFRRMETLLNGVTQIITMKQPLRKIV